MNDDELTARLAWSRKQMMQRKNKPLAKHADETLASREAYEERAGILELDAGMTRAEAEKIAALAVGFEIVNNVKRRRLEKAARLGIVADDAEKMVAEEEGPCSD